MPENEPKEKLLVEDFVTRLEIISKKEGRILVKYGLDGIQTSFQDEGRTLKIFIP